MLPGLAFRLELDAVGQLVPDPSREIPTLRGAVVGEDRVALARETLVQLDRQAPQMGVAALQLDDGLDDVLFVAQVLEPVRQGYPRLPEHLPAPALGAEVVQLRIVPVQRDVEPYGEAPLQRRAVEAGHVRRCGIGDGRPDALYQAWPLEDLLRQRLIGGVVAAQQRQPPAGVAERDAREEVQEVVYDRRRDGLARDEDEVGAGHAQQHQHAQQPLLVVVHARDLRQLLRVEREAGDHHDGLGSARIRDDPLRQRYQPLLYPREAPELLGRARLRYTPTRNQRRRNISHPYPLSGN